MEEGSTPDRPLAPAPWLTAPESRRVLAALASGGRPARFVGGCVRDGLLDPARDVADLDLATPERPERVTALCRAAGLKVIPTGLKHGTVTVHAGARTYEVTTLRRDVATDGRHAVVEFTDDFAADAARRDFTINAMSCDAEGRLFDPFNGREDLAAGRVRFVGDARARIIEDYLRILRYFRFYARFGRAPADAEALGACAELVGGIGRLSGERVRLELLKLLVAPGAVASLGLMREAGVLGHVLPEAGAIEPLERFATAWPEADALVRLALLLRSGRADAPEVERVAERLRLSVKERERLVRLVTLQAPDVRAAARTVRRGFYALGGAGTYLDLLRLRLALEDKDQAEATPVEELASGWREPALPVSGDDLLARGVPPGPRLGAVLGAVRAWWAERDFAPDRAACLARLDEVLRAEGEAAPQGGPAP